MNGLETAIEIVSRRKGIESDKLSPDMRLFHDLAIDGDDAEELLTELRDKHQVKFDGFVFSDYFGSEVGSGYRYCLYKLFNFFGLSLDGLKALTIKDLGIAIDNGCLK